MKYKSFDDWKRIGYHVIKGEKSFKRSLKNVPLFSEKQVEKTITGYYQQPDYNEEDYEITDYELCAGEWGD